MGEESRVISQLPPPQDLIRIGLYGPPSGVRVVFTLAMFDEINATRSFSDFNSAQGSNSSAEQTIETTRLTASSADFI